MKITRQKFDIQHFIEKAELPAVPIYIQGKEYIMLIDTGSDASYMNTKDLEEMPKVVVGEQDAIIGGTFKKEINSGIYKIEFACGCNEYKESFIENDFTLLFDNIEQNSGIRLSGILGSKFLIEHKCILDFENLIFYL
jgi:hypothetical protein